jgi:hypothetical protein
MCANRKAVSWELESHDPRLPTCTKRVAAILEQNVLTITMDWLDRVERDGELTRVPLSTVDRMGQFPRLVWELAYRLPSLGRPGAQAASEAAAEQGTLRQSQGYSMRMIIEESHLLEVSIFEALYSYMSHENFCLVLSNPQTITDELDSQLRQTLASFTRQVAKKAA